MVFRDNKNNNNQGNKGQVFDPKQLAAWPLQLFQAGPGLPE